MYNNLHVAGVGGFANVSYWSSTENNSNFLWNQFFISGIQDISGKSDTFRVRAARAF